MPDNCKASVATNMTAPVSVGIAGHSPVIPAIVATRGLPKLQGKDDVLADVALYHFDRSVIAATSETRACNMTASRFQAPT